MLLRIYDIVWDDSFAYTGASIPAELLPHDLDMFVGALNGTGALPSWCMVADRLTARFKWPVKSFIYEESTRLGSRYVKTTLANLRWPQGCGGLPKSAEFDMRLDDARRKGVVRVGDLNSGETVFSINLDLACAAAMDALIHSCSRTFPGCLSLERRPWVFSTILGESDDGLRYDRMRCSAKACRTVVEKANKTDELPF